MPIKRRSRENNRPKEKEYAPRMGEEKGEKRGGVSGRNLKFGRAWTSFLWEKWANGSKGKQQTKSMRV